MVLLVLVLLYGIETMIWRENERSRIRAVQMDKLRDLLGVRRRDRVPNARTRKLCGVAKRVDEMVDESVKNDCLKKRKKLECGADKESGL